MTRQLNLLKLLFTKILSHKNWEWLSNSNNIFEFNMENTQETQISFHMTKSMCTSVISSLVCIYAILNLHRPGISSNVYSCAFINPWNLLWEFWIFVLKYNTL